MVLFRLYPVNKEVHTFSKGISLVSLFNDISTFMGYLMP